MAALPGPAGSAWEESQGSCISAAAPETPSSSSLGIAPSLQAVRRHSSGQAGILGTARAAPSRSDGPLLDCKLPGHRKPVRSQHPGPE